ncbi:4,5-DOPA dioxygenase extradiol [Legionella rowbothamii]|uniref:4,5-DOPA-extradiol-dioxygenase n=1 Tax=Legionella rowbothamii TaxID=96229 RepID=UPI001F5E7706|nr:4,5-DOPA dioxygenase extradiol [Legionella rowbothamii]
MTNQQSKNAERMPVLFIGHGSPMNAIEVNEFTECLQKLGQCIPPPKAILCISAHWLTEGTWVTHMPHPKTIHDFYGFPQALFDIDYPAPGSPEVADLVRTAIEKPAVQPDNETWGLDHGTWSVLRHLYPKADIPVVQLSIYFEQPGEYHYRIGQQLKSLRDQGILIVGSGNVVHNLPKIVWGKDPKPYTWAIEFDAWIKEMLIVRNVQALTTEYANSEAGKLSVPTPDHYYPLLYTLGAMDEADELSFIYEGIQNSSISMRTLSFGL